jgi:hypothetical protein
MGPRHQLADRAILSPSRRDILAAGALSALGLTPLLKTLPASSAVAPASAKQVLLVWLWGGPSQLDTFDPKPSAPMEYRGPFSTIPTRTPGLRFTDLFPQLAAQSHRFSILRAMHTASNDHGVAGTVGLTGSMAGGVGLDGKPKDGTPRPTIGSTVARLKGASGPLPSFVVVGGKLHQGKKAIVGEGAGPLGGLYDPFRLIQGPEDEVKAPSLELPPGMTKDRMSARQRLLAGLDSDPGRRHGPRFEDHRRRAFEMLSSAEPVRAFDLTREKPATRERYGLTRFGQACLLGRRLIEAGIPFVQVNWSDHVEAEEDAGDGGWDHHYRNFQIMQDRHAPWLDHSLSALLEDLDARGLLKTTLVLAVGEFGRTPKINDKAGRDHWEHCYCALVAGGGVRGGRVVGESDARAERPKEMPTTPADLISTIHHALGVTSEQAQALNISLAGARVVEQLF